MNSVKRLICFPIKAQLCLLVITSHCVKFRLIQSFLKNQCIENILMMLGRMYKNSNDDMTADSRSVDRRYIMIMRNK